MISSTATTGPCGVLFIATGQRYIRAAMRAAETVRRHAPDLPIHLFADWQHHGLHFDVSPAPFTTVATIEHPHPRSKVDYLARTPFERTLYLDTDTAVTDDIRSLFALLERFDMGMAHAHRRCREDLPSQTSIPSTFPQFNCGVLLYRRTPGVVALLEEWSRAYAAAGLPQDQPTFRELIWASDLRVATLPPEYNVRFLKYHLLWYPSEAKTRILHHPRFHEGPFWWVRRLLRVPRRLARNLAGHDALPA